MVAMERWKSFKKSIFLPIYWQVLSPLYRETNNVMV